MTPEERLQPWIVAQHRAAVGLEPTPPEYNDPRPMFRDEPAVLAYAKAEVQRLRERGLRGPLVETDHESKIRCQAIEALIKFYEESP